MEPSRCGFCYSLRLDQPYTTNVTVRMTDPGEVFGVRANINF
jgi:hypothetical protein